MGNVSSSLSFPYKAYALNRIFRFMCRSGNKILRGRKFDVVIIDEAAQATEPDCWIALMKGRKVIMVSLL